MYFNIIPNLLQGPSKSLSVLPKILCELLIMFLRPTCYIAGPYNPLIFDHHGIFVK
jgi:hypothetical protein